MDSRGKGFGEVPTTPNPIIDLDSKKQLALLLLKVLGGEPTKRCPRLQEEFPREVPWTPGRAPPGRYPRL